MEVITIILAVSLLIWIAMPAGAKPTKPSSKFEFYLSVAACVIGIVLVVAAVMDAERRQIVFASMLLLMALVRTVREWKKINVH